MSQNLALRLNSLWIKEFPASVFLIIFNNYNYIIAFKLTSVILKNNTKLLLEEKVDEPELLLNTDEYFFYADGQLIYLTKIKYINNIYIYYK